MSWQVLVDVDARGPLPGPQLAESLAAHPLLAAVSVNAPAPPPAGWRRALAGFGRTRPGSVLVEVEAAERREAERVARAAVEDALARLGIEARLSAAAFRS